MQAMSNILLADSERKLPIDQGYCWFAANICATAAAVADHKLQHSNFKLQWQWQSHITSPPCTVVGVGVVVVAAVDVVSTAATPPHEEPIAQCGNHGFTKKK
jgi:hypothetical protein